MHKIMDGVPDVVKHLVEGNGGGIVRGSASFVDANTLALADEASNVAPGVKHETTANDPTRRGSRS